MKMIKLILILIISSMLTACGTNEADSTEVSETVSIIEGTSIVRAKERETEVLEKTETVEDTITANQTCTSNGVKTFTCSCGHSYTEAIAALGGHIGYNKDIISFATCNSEGLVEYSCVGCGDTYTEVLPIEDHNWGHKTLSTNGVITKVCDYCTHCGLEKECTGCKFSN